MPLDVCGAAEPGADRLPAAGDDRRRVLRAGDGAAGRQRCSRSRACGPRDPAFRNPTKFIGPYFTEAQARRREAQRGWVMKADPHGGWRRVVPSPRPYSIVETPVIRAAHRRRRDRDRGGRRRRAGDREGTAADRPGGRRRQGPRRRDPRPGGAGLDPAGPHRRPEGPARVRVAAARGHRRDGRAGGEATAAAGRVRRGVDEAEGRGRAALRRGRRRARGDRRPRRRRRGAAGRGGDAGACPSARPGLRNCWTIRKSANTPTSPRGVARHSRKISGQEPVDLGEQRGQHAAHPTRCGYRAGTRSRSVTAFRSNDHAQAWPGREPRADPEDMWFTAAPQGGIRPRRRAAEGAVPVRARPPTRTPGTRSCGAAREEPPRRRPRGDGRARRRGARRSPQHAPRSTDVRRRPAPGRVRTHASRDPHRRRRLPRTERRDPCGGPRGRSVAATRSSASTTAGRVCWTRDPSSSTCRPSAASFPAAARSSGARASNPMREDDGPGRVRRTLERHRRRRGHRDRRRGDARRRGRPRPSWASR